MRFELFICIHAAWANKQSKSKASGKTGRVISGMVFKAVRRSKALDYRLDI
jgi:hypothetical protein